MRKDAYSFASDIDKEIESFSNSEYINKTGRCKRLREEIYPISRLALYFKKPGLQVDVEAFEDSGEADGHISIKGFREMELDVQVTFVFNYQESLRNELLADQGHAPGFGKISQNKKSKEIIAEMEGTDDQEQIASLSERIIERFSAKQKKNYNSKMILIVAFEDITFGGRSAWNNLFIHLKQPEINSASNFISGYLINCASNEIYKWF